MLEIIWVNVNHTKMYTEENSCILEERIDNVLSMLGKWLELKGKYFVEGDVERKQDLIHSKTFSECLLWAVLSSSCYLSFQEHTF